MPTADEDEDGEDDDLSPASARRWASASSPRPSADDGRVLGQRAPRAYSPTFATAREKPSAAGARTGADAPARQAPARRPRSGRRRSARRGRRARSRASPCRPADRARRPAGLREQRRGHQRGREVQRGHRGQRVAAERAVERIPALAPEVFAELDHHPPHLRGFRARLSRGVPRRRRGNQPVEDRRPC